MAAFPSLDTTMSRPSSGIASPPHRMAASRSRTQSISSDRPSTIGHGFMSPPLSVSPEAAFIAASAASQIVTNDHDSHADAWYDQHGVEPSSETAIVSPAALQLVNNFLDQLLFNFLSVSRSTTLATLRPAVSEVLKPKLAKDAVNQADEELREYLGGGDDDDLAPSQEPTSPGDWDLELVWKRTRLRCMVYSSLGDMEEEDEDYYMDQEHLDAGLEDRISDVVSPAVAIFLTSILEFMGEQALVVAGQASYHRMRVKYEKDLKDGSRSPSDVADRICVEELDMERVALDRTLGRLWRAWKKKIRSPGIGVGMDYALARTYSRDSLRGSHLRSPSISAEATVPATVPEPTLEQPDQARFESPAPKEDNTPESAVDEFTLAMNIPLPVGPRDLDEIEVPGLASYSDEEDDGEEEDDEVERVRPKSLMIWPSVATRDMPTPTGSQPHTPIFASRKRSNSLPTPTATPYNSPPPKARGELSDRTDNLQDQGTLAAVPNENPIEETYAQGAQGDILDDETRPANVLSESSDVLPTSATVADIEARPALISPVANGRFAVPRRPVDEEMKADLSDADDADEFSEEPQILTSSRISISGRSSSPTTSEHGKPLTINVNQPARPPSLHSLRLIEVSSPRSPVPRSGGSSVDAAEHIRAGNLSRANSVRTPPIAEESVVLEAPPASRVATGPNISRSAALANESIWEAEEVATVDESEARPITMDTATAAPVEQFHSSADGYTRDAPASGAIFGSATRHTSPPASPRARPPATKVTILPSPSASGTFFIQDPPEPYDAPVGRSRVAAPAPISVASSVPPAVPERSPSRQALASMPTSISQPTSIGIVSVDRPRARTTSDTSAPRMSDQATTAPGTRPVHTSVSSTSSARLKALRTSEESSHTHVDVARNFEELIQSDQTIQYTLTPESMRDLDTTRTVVTSSPAKSRKSEDARQNGDQSRSSSVNNNPRAEVKRSTSISRSTGLHSHPVNETQLSGARAMASGLRPAPAVPSKPRAAVPQARDARLPRESLSDLSEFLRSTGPLGGSPATSGTIEGVGARATGPSALRTASGPVPTKNSVESSRASTTSQYNRSRLQARDAAVDYKDDNSDLIDFIRRGPPSTAGNHRIPRNVAPFRTTMDSDQMAAAVGGRAVDAQIREIDVRSSQASTNITESSFNSQSALLGRNKASVGMTSQFGGVDEDDMPMPKRKTRRVRDPYAIDLSDEDELDESEPTPKANRRAPPQEESLADFLKNYSPPPEPVSQPIMQNRPKKKASAPSLMSRFGRRDNGATGSSGSSSPKSPTKGVVDSRSLNSRAGGGRGYIPIQVNIPSGADTYGVGQGYGSVGGSTQFGGANGSVASAPGRRIPMKKFEPRDAVSVSSRGTSDLAAFLKNSEPPPGITSSGSAATPMTGEDGGGLSKVFGRRKKSSIV